ncbi:MAG: energy-coupling factor ABC transporter ATP-binding protein, partial [Nanoarchaeota archaeon]|nr:energy-coupling factor ABC transporter ATP-binding protein [Nanoarchaeota archaeon]
MNVIEANNLTYRYPDEKDTVLRDLSFRIKRNSFTALIGPSGCGKTTLLMLIRGFFQEYGGKIKGKILVLGKDVIKTDFNKLGKDIGIIFQDPQVQLHQLRVIDEVASAPMYQGLAFDECQKRAKELIDKILDPSFYNKSPAELSSGQQQKVALAATLAMDCEILLLDEPFSFLDTTAFKEVLDILLELKKQGKTIVIATHGIEQIAGVADELILLQDGQIVLQAKPKFFLYNSRLKTVLEPPLSIKVGKEVKKQAVDWSNLLKNKKFDKKISKKPIETKKEVVLEVNNLSFNYPETLTGVKKIN